MTTPADVAPVEEEFTPRTSTRRTYNPPVSGFDPDEIGTVDEKVDAFHRLYPEGAIDASDIEQIGENAWRVTAYVWKVKGDGRADSSASATRSLDTEGHISGEHPLESAQSVAIGRALRFLGIRLAAPFTDADA